MGVELISALVSIRHLHTNRRFDGFIYGSKISKRKPLGLFHAMKLQTTCCHFLNCRREASRMPAALGFVLNNPSFNHSYDIVKGPVANDRVYATLSLWEEGFLDEDETIRRLKTFKLVDQILFHTDKSLSYLHFQKAEAIQ